MAEGQPRGVITELCWTDTNTLMGMDPWKFDLVKYTINTTAKTCQGEVIESGSWIYTGRSSHGKLYITGYDHTLIPPVITVVIYDPKTGNEDVWNTKIVIKGNGRVSLSLNADFIIINYGNASHVYNTDRVFQYKITHTHKHSLPRGYLTYTGMFWYWDPTTSTLYITNLLTNETHVSDNGNTVGNGISDTRNGYVYVSVSQGVDVYSQNGTFYYHIQIDLPRQAWYGYKLKIAAISVSDNEALIAVTTFNDTTPIAIFRVDE